MAHPNSDHSGWGCQWPPLGQWLRVSGCTLKRKQVLQFLLSFRNVFCVYLQSCRTGKQGRSDSPCLVFPRDIYFPKPRQSVIPCFKIYWCHPEINNVMVLCLLCTLQAALGVTVSPNIGLLLRVWWFLTVYFTLAPRSTYQHPIFLKFLRLSLLYVLLQLNRAQALS